MAHYVVGFLFDEAYENVVLVRKQRPTWQKGKLNGVGGLVERGESPDVAMAREFVEESGLHVSQAQWCFFAELICKSGDKVDFFYQTCHFSVPEILRANAESGRMFQEGHEPVCVYRIDEIKEADCLPNIPWLVEAAISFKRGETAQFFTIVEHRR